MAGVPRRGDGNVQRRVHPPDGRACNSVAHCDIECMSTPAQPVRLVRPEKKRRRIPVAVIMALSFGTLVLLSVGGVLALSVGANVRNTFDLLGAQSTLLIDAMEDSLRAEMGRAESAVDGVAKLYAQGEFQIDDEAMSAALAGALAAAPGVNAMLICTPDLICRGAAVAGENDEYPAGTIRKLPAETEKSPQVRAVLEERPAGRRTPVGRLRGQRIRPVRQCLGAAGTRWRHEGLGDRRGRIAEICPKSRRNCRRASARMPSFWMATDPSWRTSGWPIRMR